MAPRQRHFEQRLGHENRREQVRDQTDEQRDGEAADRSGAELEQKRARDKCRDVRVDQRPEHAGEAGVNRRADAAFGFELLLDALEDQHVRIDADPHRQHEARDARQRHHRADVRHQAQKDDEVEDERDDGVDAGQLVVDQHEADDQEQADDRCDDTGPDRVGAEARADRSLREIGQRGRQGTRAQDEREVLDLVRREAAGDAPLGRDPRFDPRRRLDAAVQNDRELAADVLAGHLAELPSAFVVQREAHRGLIVLVDRRPRVAQITAGDGGHLPHQVVNGARITGRAGCARHDFHARRHLPVGHERFLRRRRPLLDDLQFEQSRRSHDLLRALDVGDARKLHENLIAARALLRDARLSDAELIDAALDRLPRLHDRLVAEIHLHVRLHREGVAAVRPGAAIEVRLHFVRGRSERRVLRRRHAVDAELRRVDRLDGGKRDVLRLQLFAEPLGLEIRFEAQRIVGLDAQVEMDAALEIEPELQLLVHQPARRVDALARGENRIHADGREDNEDGDDRDDFPAKVLHNNPAA